MRVAEVGTYAHQLAKGENRARAQSSAEVAALVAAHGGYERCPCSEQRVWSVQQVRGEMVEVVELLFSCCYACPELGGKAVRYGRLVGKGSTSLVQLLATCLDVHERFQCHL